MIILLRTSLTLLSFTKKCNSCATNEIHEWVIDLISSLFEHQQQNIEKETEKKQW